MNDLINVKYDNEEIVFKIENGQSFVRIDNVAKFCGFSRIKNEKEYIMWDRVNEYLIDLGFPQKCGSNDFIPEYIMYALIGKAKNDKATKFMLWVGQVLTEIRSKGKYDTIEHEIMKIEDKQERKLTLAVYKLEEVYKIDNDEFTALRLENKKRELVQYKQEQKLVELENKIKDNKEVIENIDNKIKKATVLREGDMSAEVIAKKFNIFSTSGKPHNKFAENMAKVLGIYINPEGNVGYSDDFVSINLTTRGGITIPTIKYSKLAYEEFEKYVNENGLHIEVPATLYKRKCKNGNVGDFNYSRIIFDEIEQSIKINKITYNLYNNLDEE